MIQTISIAPCHPSVSLPPCGGCARRRDGNAPLVERRRCGVIDGSVAAIRGMCRLFIPYQTFSKNNQTQHP